jgi:hypothetical protein
MGGEAVPLGSGTEEGAMTGTRRHGSGRLHALLATALCRLYVTLFLAVIALPSARSWGVAWLVVGLGLAVDLARNLALPDLRLPLAELARRVAADPSTLRPEERLRGHGFGLLWALVWALWGYVLAVLALDALLGTRALEPWLRLLEPAHAAAAAVLRVAREDAAALEAWATPTGRCSFSTCTRSSSASCWPVSWPPRSPPTASSIASTTGTSAAKGYQDRDKAAYLGCQSHLSSS